MFCTLLTNTSNTNCCTEGDIEDCLLDCHGQTLVEVLREIKEMPKKTKPPTLWVGIDYFQLKHPLRLD